MPFEAPDNERSVESLTPRSQNQYRMLLKGANDLSARKPDEDTTIVTKYLHDFLIEEQKNSARTVAFDAENRGRIQAGDPPLDRWAHKRIVQNNRQEFDRNFILNHVQNASPETQRAFRDYMAELRGPSLIGGVVRQFYNSEKGGVQLGGLVGALLGGLAGYKLLSASGGGWFGLAVGAFATLTGAWLGNKASAFAGDVMQRYKASAPGANVPAKAPEKTPAEPKAGKVADLPSDTRRAAYETVKNTGAGTPHEYDIVSTAGGPSKPKTTDKNPRKNPAGGAPPAFTGGGFQVGK